MVGGFRKKEEIKLKKKGLKYPNINPSRVTGDERGVMTNEKIFL